MREEKSGQAEVTHLTVGVMGKGGGGVKKEVGVVNSVF